MQRLARSLTLLVASLAIAAPAASAHFLWLTIRGHDAEQIVLTFTEGRFDDTMPMLIPSLERAQLVLPGETPSFAPGQGGLVAAAPPDLDLFGAHLVYGLFGRADPAPLLTYDAKGARDLEAAGRALGLGVELLATRDGDDLVLTVLDAGEPSPGAQVVLVEDGTLFEEELETDDEGAVRLPFPASTIVYARARVVQEGSGEWDGQAYDQILRYATLTIERLNAPQVPAGSDIEAWLVLDCADLRRETLPDDVVGLTGGLAVALDGVRHSARFTVLGGEVEILESETLDESERATVAAMLHEAVAPLHGPVVDFRGGEAVRFGPTNGTGRGHDIVLGGDTRLRVREQVIEEIRRREGESTVVRTLGQTMESEFGRLLPVTETRTRFDADGAVVEHALVTRDYAPHEDAELPTIYRELHVGAERTVRRELEFDAVELVRGGTR